ncbi:hypothetical protein RHSIM_Rhsim01G0117300 [Rhododendron simsii]|uniref:Uncharacterized protein n=1 Tax=Rhododendron simsii TaxID=118357 RepID=A0A834HI58_RHOSS|nr:hypothetical protein RHSIM_Rhsim01G0117300 [Rhododendron simsii]
MARVFSQALTRLSSTSPKFPNPTTLSYNPPSPLSPRILTQRNRSNQSGKAQLLEVDLDSSSSSSSDGASAGGEVEVMGVRRLEDVIHGIIVRRSAPDWLPFVPGSSYWVPPRRRAPGIVEFVGKLANPLSEEESMSFATERGWPSTAYFIDVNKKVEFPYPVLLYKNVVKLLLALCIIVTYVLGLVVASLTFCFFTQRNNSGKTKLKNVIRDSAIQTMNLNPRMQRVEGNLYGELLARGRSPLYISETAETKKLEVKLWQKKTSKHSNVCTETSAMSTTPRKLMCFCYSGGERMANADCSLGKYMGGVSEATVIEEGISFKDLLGMKIVASIAGPSNARALNSNNF